MTVRRMMPLGLVIVGVLGVGPQTPAKESEPTLSPGTLRTVRELAIQHNGRHKPFESFARETLEFVTGSPTLEREEPVVTVLSIITDSERWQDTPLIAVPFVPLRERLGMDAETSRISYDDVITTRRLMRMLPPIVAKQQRNEKLSMLEQETFDVYERFVTLNALFEQDLSLVPPPSTSQTSWLPIFEASGYPQDRQGVFRTAWVAFLEAFRQGEASRIEVAARHLSTVLRSANPEAYPASWRLRLEVSYHRVAPFRLAWILYLVASCGLLLGSVVKRRRATVLGASVLWAAFFIHGGGILTRVILGGRPPVSNFYETMLWLPFVAVALALFFERIYRGRYFGMAAALLAAVTLILAERVPLDPSIAPVVAVLRSNLWLSIHVLTIVASYGALALATVLAHIYGCLFLVRREGHPALASLDLFLYRSMQVGVVLLAGGIMLGAVWANASWGRYWGWDPKETWALITLLWFLAILHGRFAGWLKGIGVALATIGGFFLLLMTYYGVSFYLVGLHSYAGGHAKPLPPLLLGYLLAETAFMALVGVAALARKRLA